MQLSHRTALIWINGLLVVALMFEVAQLAPSKQAADGMAPSAQPTALQPASDVTSSNFASHSLLSISFDALFGTLPSTPNVKDVASHESLSPPPAARVPTVAIPTCILLGIYLDADQPQSESVRRGTALVSEPSTDRTRRIRIGDQWDGWTLSSIDRRTVTFSLADQKFTLGFVADEPLEATQPPSLKMEQP